MSSKRGQKRRSCIGKKRYATKEEAWRDAVSIRRKEGCNEAVAYKCKFCASWHVGHRQHRKGMRRADLVETGGVRGTWW